MNAIRHFQTLFFNQILHFLSEGGDILKKVLFNTKIKRKKLVRSRAKFDSRVQTHDHDPMSYERSDHVKFLFISTFTHAILRIIFAVDT